jgi:cytochrome c-type biogenesis protein CcmH/NrfG
MSRKPTFDRPGGPRPDRIDRLPAGDPAADALEFLGLEGGAGADEIAAAHEALVAYLSEAPRPLWGWARAQASLADEALVTLTEPTARRSSGALSGSTVRSAEPPGGPATPPARRALPGSADAADTEDADFEAMLAEVTPSLHRESMPSGTARPAARTAAPAAQRAARMVEPAPRRIPRIALIGAAAVVALAVVGVVWKLGSVDSVPPVAATAAPSDGLDMAAVAALMEKIQANPKDVESLMALGNEFYQAGDFETALTWFQKVLAIEPANTSALLAVGAANFNLGDSATAESTWLKVLAVEPDNVEAHYDLGFLYFNSTPQNVEGVQREWGEVIRLAPESDVASIVQAHLDSLSAASSGSPAPAASGDASPAPSPAASAEASPEASK